MSKYSVDEFNRAKARMATDLDAAIAVSESSRAGEATAMRTEFGESETARARSVSRNAMERARRTAAAADGYVHESPWIVVGIAAAAGVLAGFLVARR